LALAEFGDWGQAGFFDAVERLRWLSASGDPLERLQAVVAFEAFLRSSRRRCRGLTAAAADVRLMTRC
jgi:hypothetical protein